MPYEKSSGSEASSHSRSCLSLSFCLPRFATGGQGDNSGRVVVWNMAPIRSESSETNPDIPKTLCEMTNHLGCVNCVRWSVDGKWLASGGDDAIVMIWQIKYQGVGKSSFGTSHEQWGCVHMLRGHNGDVLDLSWSPDRKYLASCSIDNTIVVWNARSFPQKCTVITGHRGLVKGLTWDPVGKYLASQSDDKTVRIWRMSDWKEEKEISAPFRHCGGTTHVLRLSWSPDGKYLVSAHALNNDGPTAQIIQRGDWKTGMDFVGHRKAIEVVCFNPHLFFKKGMSDNHGCIAIGSRDRSLSVWLTSLKRPLVVTHDLFGDSILDLSWSTDGYELMVCSTDGSVAYICFSEKELGAPLPKQAIDDLYLSTYGCKCAGRQNTLSTSADILIEDPEMLKLHGTAEKAQASTPENNKETGSPKSSVLNQSISLTSDSAKQPTITKQMESRTKDGRRRITPVMLASQPSSLSGAPLPFTSFSPKEKKGVVVRTTPENKKEQSNASRPASSEKSPLKLPTGEVLMITSPPPKTISFEPLSPKKMVDQKMEAAVTKSPASSQPKTTSFKPLGSDRSTAGQKRTLVSTSEGLSLLPKAKKLRKTRGLDTATSVSKPSTPQKTSSLHGHSRHPTLPVPDVSATVTVQIIAGTGGSDPVVIELDNSATSRCTITSRRGDHSIWVATLPSQGLLVAGNQFITCVACKDKSITLYSSLTGRLLLAKLLLQSLPHALKTTTHYLMAITADAHVSVWDTLSMKAVVRQVSFGHLFEDKKQLHGSALTKTGIPVITVGSASYMFHTDMSAWMQVCSSNELSEIGRSDFDIRSSLPDSTPLDYIQRSSSSRSDVTQMLLGLRSPSSSQAATLMFLESQVSRSLCLRSPLEYQHWTKAYIRYLVKEDMEDRLREFCMDFTGPCGCQGMVLGLQKQALLRDLLTVVAGNAKLQRLYCELRDAVDHTRDL